MKTMTVRVTPSDFMDYLSALNKEGLGYCLQESTTGKLEVWVDSGDTGHALLLYSDGRWAAEMTVPL